MDTESVMDENLKQKESGVNADVKALALQIVEETNALIAGVETLDANNWLSHADKLESLNGQLQALVV